jgi:hypothetical protein
MSNKPGNKEFTNFDGTNVPDDFEFPSLEIEDIDRAIFDLFDKEISFETEANGKTRKVPVVFSSGERFALTRRKNPIRDKNNALILPLISITRGTIDISSSQHGKGTAISFRDQPGYYVKKRLSPKDRNFQNLLNKQKIKNQDNVASKKNYAGNEPYPGMEANQGTIATRRNQGNLSFKANDVSLKEDLNKNIFEIIEVPYPQFASIKYTVTFWTQYLTESNEMLQTIFQSFSGQGYEIQTKTKDGFDLVVFFSDNFLLDTNFNSYSDDERVIKVSSECTIPGYLINTKSAKGAFKQIRSYYSAPMIEFGYKDIPTNTSIVINNQKESKLVNDKKFILSDVTLERDIIDRNKIESTEEIEQLHINPFTNKKIPVFSKIIQKNRRAGETVVSSLIINNIDNQYE